MLAVLVTVPTVMQNSLHPLSTSSIIAHHLLDFMVQGTITEADAPTSRLDAPPSSSYHFYAECLIYRNPANLSWFGLWGRQ